MICEKCGFDNMATAKFCEKCGNPIAHAEASAPGFGLKGSLAAKNGYAPPSPGASSGGLDYGTYRATSAGFAPAASFGYVEATPAPVYVPEAAPAAPVYAPVAPAYTPAAPAAPAYAPEIPVYNPEVSAPVSEAAAPAFDSAPAYAAPAYDSAPGYAAPAYDSAPAYATPAYDSTPGYAAPAYDSAPAYAAPAYDGAPGYAPDGYYGYNPSTGNKGLALPVITLIGAVLAVVALFLNYLKSLDASIFNTVIESVGDLGTFAKLGDFGMYMLALFVILLGCIICAIATMIMACLKKNCRSVSILGFVLLITSAIVPFVFGVGALSDVARFSGGDIMKALEVYIKEFEIGFWMYLGGMLVAAIGGGKR